MSEPIHIKSTDQFKSLVKDNTYVLIDFHAAWCGPCHQIAPIYTKLSTENSTPNQFAFVKVDVDEQSDIAQEYGISAMPTFVLLKNGEVEKSVRGANPPAIKALVSAAAADVKASAATKKADDVPTVSGSYTVSSNPSWKTELK
jgi:thioredoxin 1